MVPPWVGGGTRWCPNHPDRLLLEFVMTVGKAFVENAFMSIPLTQRVAGLFSIYAQTVSEKDTSKRLMPPFMLASYYCYSEYSQF